MVPDLEADGEPWEVETLFGTGPHPVKKLHESVEKHREGGRVNLVVPNVGLALYGSDIARSMRAWERDGVKVSVWGTNLEDLSLSPFREQLKNLGI